jgi:hypothetical protein
MKVDKVDLRISIFCTYFENDKLKLCTVILRKRMNISFLKEKIIKRHVFSLSRLKKQMERGALFAR